MWKKVNGKYKKISIKILTVYLAICWIMLAFFGLLYMYNKKYVYPLKYKELVFEYADYYGLDRALIFAVIEKARIFSTGVNFQAVRKLPLSSMQMVSMISPH